MASADVEAVPTIPATRVELDAFVSWLRQHPQLIGAETIVERYGDRVHSRLQGHVKQSFFGARAFLQANPQVATGLAIQLRGSTAPRSAVPHLAQPVMDLWAGFADTRRDVVGSDPDLGFSFQRLLNTLPPSLGGTRAAGGGSSSTFKRVLPLVACYLASRSLEHSEVGLVVRRQTPSGSSAIPSPRETSAFLGDLDRAESLQEVAEVVTGFERRFAIARLAPVEIVLDTDVTMELLAKQMAAFDRTMRRFAAAQALGIDPLEAIRQNLAPATVENFLVVTAVEHGSAKLATAVAIGDLLLTALGLGYVVYADHHTQEPSPSAAPPAVNQTVVQGDHNVVAANDGRFEITDEDTPDNDAYQDLCLAKEVRRCVIEFEDGQISR
ncbi:MAG: hypothetical protein JWM86_2557, partial [Thermoleophilia bacterium]|nr:hypothetical protein [Thermoleophilia bacterium]